jgi:hypothetical protein
LDRRVNMDDVKNAGFAVIARRMLNSPHCDWCYWGKYEFDMTGVDLTAIPCLRCAPSKPTEFTQEDNNEDSNTA